MEKKIANRVLYSTPGKVLARKVAEHFERRLGVPVHVGATRRAGQPYYVIYTGERPAFVAE